MYAASLIVALVVACTGSDDDTDGDDSPATVEATATTAATTVPTSTSTPQATATTAGTATPAATAAAEATATPDQTATAITTASATPTATPSSTATAQAPLTITSSAFTQNQVVPDQYTCDGANVSPPLAFSNVPAGTAVLVLIMDDPDAPGGTWDHWIRFNIPVSSGLAQGASSTQSAGSPSVVGTPGLNSFGNQLYGGPCPPEGDGDHRYVFKLYALDAALDLAAGATKAQIEAAMAGHILAQAQLIGVYARD
jgi:Raf kinase inhibitor-like YbhB/YbcL family protein